MASGATSLISEGEWMWPISHHWDLHNSFALFRNEASLDRLPESAPLQITADQSYQLYINGVYVCSGPARGYQDEWPYDEIDIVRFLKPGKNVFAVRAYHPGVSNFRYITQGYAGVLLAADLGECRVRSGAHWRGRRQSGVVRDTIPTSLQLFFQEHIDLNEEPPEWMCLDYDDEGWDEPVVALRWNARPWTGLQPRGIPLLDESVIHPMNVIGWSSGLADASGGNCRDVCLVRYREGLAHQPFLQPGGRFVFKGEGSENFESFLIDFGRTVVGSVSLNVEEAEGGEVLDFSCYERIDPQTLTPVYIPNPHSKMAFGGRMICRSGAQQHTFYHPFGFRYVIVTARKLTHPLKVDLSLRNAVYPVEEKGRFNSSDESLNVIWRCCAWTQRVCSLDAFVDTPWREQAQWWGDARIQAKNTFFLSADTRLFRRGIAQIAKQRAGQLTYGHAPTMAHGCVLPDFTLVWLLTLWDFYWQTGSLEPLQTHRATALDALAYFDEQICTKTGLLPLDQRYWLFLDWTDLYKEGYSITYNLLYLYTLQRMRELFAQEGGNDAVLAEIATRIKRLAMAVKELFLADGLLAEGLDLSLSRVERISVHAQTLAIMTGIDPARDHLRLERVLLPFIRGENCGHIKPSCYWVSYVLEALGKVGYGDEVITYIRQNWKEMAEHGTTWEVFQPTPGEESFSHAWSAHPLFHLMELAGGVRQSSAGWQEVTLLPPVLVGDGAEVIYPTPFGEIVSRWTLTQDDLIGELTLPSAVTARISLPGHLSKVQGNETPWSFAVPRNNLQSIINQEI